MAIAFVGAGTGVEILVAGDTTVSKTGCTAGNFVMFANFDADDSGAGQWVSGTAVNVEDLAGNPNSVSAWVNAVNRTVFFGRVMANGTVSWDGRVVAGDVDSIFRIYEFSGVATGATLNDVREASGESGPATSTSILDKGITTLGDNRLAIQIVNVRSSAALGPFTGETGGDWTEAAEYNGSTLTQQLQTATMASAGTIDGGTITISSAYWLVTGCALIPAPDAAFAVPGRTYKRLYGPAQLTGSAADLYTVPAGTRTRVRHLHVSNPSGSSVDVTLSAGADGAATRILDGFPIAADSIYSPRRAAEYTLEAGEKLQGWASTGATVVLVVDGFEETI